MKPEHLILENPPENAIKKSNIEKTRKTLRIEVQRTRAQETEIVAFSKYILKVLWEQLFEREH
jgi:hypothetical protein